MQWPGGTKEQLQELSSEAGRAVSSVGMCPEWWWCAVVLLPIPRWAGQFQLLISAVMRQGGKALRAAGVAACRTGEHKPRNAAGNRAPMNLWEQGWGSELLCYFQDTAPLSCHWRTQPKSSLVLTDIAVWPQKSHLMWRYAAGSGNCSRFGWWHKCQGTPVMALLCIDHDFVCQDIDLWRATQLSLIQDKQHDLLSHITYRSYQKAGGNTACRFSGPMRWRVFLIRVP